MSTIVDFPVKPEARPYLDAFSSTARASRSGCRAAASGASAALPNWASRAGAARIGAIWICAARRKTAAPRREPRGVRCPRRLTEIFVAGPACRLVFVDACFSPELSPARSSARRRFARPDLGGDRRRVRTCANRARRGFGRCPRRPQHGVFRRRICPRYGAGRGR